MIHPLSPSACKTNNSRVVERIGNKSESAKNDKYEAMAQLVDCRFSPLVFYSYGGFHRSALSFIKAMATALDEQACKQPARN